MPLEKDIELFQVWAAKLGCPPDAIPTEDALKAIFKSRQRDLFCNLIKRVRSRQDVQEVRENILIKSLDKIKDQIVPTSARAFLPKEMQIFLKMNELKKYKEDITIRLDEYRKEYESLALNIKTKNIQHISLQNKQKTLKSHVNILAFKSMALGKQIKQEGKNKELLITTMPVRLTSKNASETLALDGVKLALRDLDDFYIFYINQANSSNIIQEAKEALWVKMRAIFSNIPNFIFFNVIMRLKDEQLQYIMSLINKANIEDSSTHSISGVGGTKEPLSPFEIKLLQTKADLLGMVVKYLSARKERIMLEERFSDAYGPFVDELQKKVNLFNVNAGENINEMISDYLVQYNLRNFSKSQNDFITQQIEQCKADIDYGARQLENHEVILGSIRKVYSDINTSINRIQYEMLQLGQIKEKILYSKNMLKRLLDDMQMSSMGNGNASTNGGSKSNFQPTKLKLNNNISTIGDSFEMVGGDMVFSSTKLDFDSTMMSLNTTTTNITGASRRSVGCADITLMPAATGSNNNEGRFNLPPYLSEFCTFTEIPFEKFSCITKNCAYHLSPNPLIVETRELSSTMQLAPGSLLTASGALQEVRNRIKWADLIAQHSLDLKLDLDLIMVDAHSCRQKMKQHREKVEELLDKIDVNSINTNRTLHKLSKLYDFIFANPLRHYIPSERNYNNQTYADYEAEFSMYHRMATNGASIK